MTSHLIENHFALPGQPLPAVDESKLVQYFHGSNGVLACSRRPGVEVGLPVGVCFQQVRGLAPLTPYVKWELPRVPRRLVRLMLAVSRDVSAREPAEALFYLSHCAAAEAKDAVASENGWNLEVPRQRATDQSVEPLETGHGTATDRALIEVHSHHSMQAEFSAGDDREELDWFRVYAVLGTIFDAPRVRARVALFGHVCEWPASDFFEMPEELSDSLGAAL